MSRSLDYSLFKFAPRELSHSAFWAWTLKNTEPAPEADIEVARLGHTLLRRVGVPLPKSKITVQTEVTLPDDLGRIDIHAIVDGSSELVVENKTSALLDPGQLETYRQKQDELDCRFVIMSTSFDPEYENAPVEGWQYLGENELLDIVEVTESQHPTIVDYHVWLRGLVDRRTRLKEGVLSADARTRNCALRHHVGQWALLKRLKEEIDPSGDYDQYLGTNRGGQPWTQLRFADETVHFDALLYRIDTASFGPYLSLRQYQADPTPSVEAKKERRTKLRQLWRMAIQDVGPEALDFRKPRNWGKKECEVAVLALGHHHSAAILRELPDIHRRFVSTLRAEGWSLR